MDHNEDQLAISVCNTLKVLNTNQLFVKINNLEKRMKNEGLFDNDKNDEMINKNFSYKSLDLEKNTKYITLVHEVDIDISSIEFNMDGNWILVGLNNGTIHIIDIHLDVT